MESSRPENLTADQKRAVQELTQGRELANQLRIMLSNHLKADEAGDLVTKILRSFKNSLMILNSSNSDEASQVLANTGGSSDGGQKAEEDSGESSKTSTFKERRGCYKRRRTSESVTKYTSTLIDDGHAWRKYGQKVILNANYPRNYFRCTHKFDHQGCTATKQVQRTEEDPPVYRTTYHGHHTCATLLQPLPHFIFDSTNNSKDSSSSILLSFESNQSPNTTPSFPSIKQEINHNNNDVNDQSSPSTDHYLLPNLTTTAAFGSEEEPLAGLLLSPAGSDHGAADVISSSAVYSCTNGTTSNDHSFEMDMMVHFEDDMVMDSFFSSCN